jgi:dTDP-glucose 4,6-dehydratase
MILVTGGAGFIGANFVLDWIAVEGTPVVNLDMLTYAGNIDNLASVAKDARHGFVHGDISDRALVASLLKQHQPSAIVHFAAESHVDRSIHGPGEFVQFAGRNARLLVGAAPSRKRPLSLFACVDG